MPGRNQTAFTADQAPEQGPGETSEEKWPPLPPGNLWHLSKARYGLVRHNVNEGPKPHYSLECEEYTPPQYWSPPVALWTRSQPFTWPMMGEALFGRPETGLQHFPECVILDVENARHLFNAVWALGREKPEHVNELRREVFMRWCWNMDRHLVFKPRPHLTVEELQFFETEAPHTNFNAVPPCFLKEGQNMVEVYSAVVMQQPGQGLMAQLLTKLAARDDEIAQLRKERDDAIRKLERVREAAAD